MYVAKYMDSGAIAPVHIPWHRLCTIGSYWNLQRRRQPLLLTVGLGCSLPHASVSLSRKFGIICICPSFCYNRWCVPLRLLIARRLSQEFSLTPLAAE